MEPKSSFAEKRWDYCNAQPKEAVEYLNTTTKQCLKRERYGYKRLTPQHALRWHNVRVLTLDEILKRQRK